MQQFTLVVTRFCTSECTVSVQLNRCGGTIGGELQLFSAMQLVMLAGELGEKYGKQHEYYNLQTPADAIKLLCINYPALKQEMVEAHRNGVGYKVVQGGAAMGYDELRLPFGSKPLMVVPVISGAGGQGTGQILLGVGLVAASFLLPGAGLFGATGLFGAGGAGIVGVSSAAVLNATALGTTLSAVGAGLILSGTANLISPQPQLPNVSSNRIKGESTNVRGPGPDGITAGGTGVQSYAFTGPSNTVGTGATLPVIYGQVITGSHLLAVNLDVTDESDPLKLATQTPGRKTLKINGEELTNKLEDCGGIESKRGVKRLKGSDSDRNKRIKVDKTFGPSESQTLTEDQQYDTDDDGSISPLKYKKDDRKKLDVIFEINKGLYDFVARPGTTKIDGFIRYRINASITVSGDEVTLANAEVTLQGLANETQSFRFGHRLEMPKVKDKDGNDLDLRIEILEVGLHDDATFTVHGYGYDLL